MTLHKIAMALLVTAISGQVTAGTLEERGTPYSPKPISVAYAYKIDHSLDTKQQLIRAMPSTWQIRVGKQVLLKETGPILKEDTWVSYLKRVTLENNIKTTIDWKSKVVTLQAYAITASPAQINKNLINYAFTEEGTVHDVSLPSVKEDETLSLKDLFTFNMPTGWKVRMHKSFEVTKSVSIPKEPMLSNVFRQIANMLSAQVNLNYDNKIIEIKPYIYAEPKVVVQEQVETSVSAEKSTSVVSSTKEWTSTNKHTLEQMQESQLKVFQMLEDYLQKDENITALEKALALPQKEQAFLDRTQLVFLNMYSVVKYMDTAKLEQLKKLQNTAVQAKVLKIRDYIQSKSALFNPNAHPFAITAISKPFVPKTDTTTVPKIDSAPAIAENTTITEQVKPAIVQPVFILEITDLSVQKTIERWSKENGWDFYRDSDMMDFGIDERKVINAKDLKEAVVKVIEAINFYAKDTKIKYYVNFSNDGTNKTVMLSDRPFTTK